MNKTGPKGSHVQAGREGESLICAGIDTTEEGEENERHHYVWQHGS